MPSFRSGVSGRGRCISGGSSRATATDPPARCSPEPVGPRPGRLQPPGPQRPVQALAELRKREDSVTARDIAELVLRDPLMSVKVLRFSQARLTSRQPTEVTTVEHAVMMHGVASFFRQFRDLTRSKAASKAIPVRCAGH